MEAALKAGVLETALDAAESAGASNSIEKLLEVSLQVVHVLHRRTDVGVRILVRAGTTAVETREMVGLAQVFEPPMEGVRRKRPVKPATGGKQPLAGSLACCGYCGVG